MLAQNFKTPADLRIADTEFDALVKVLGMLERGELVHVNTVDMKEKSPDRVKPKAGLFNMNRWAVDFDCGTVCCIGGTAEAIGGFRFTNNTHVNLHRLFFSIPHLTYENITTGQAAIALRNYLTTGEPNWAEALAE